jgi:hypothetical protein
VKPRWWRKGKDFDDISGNGNQLPEIHRQCIVGSKFFWDRLGGWTPITARIWWFGLFGAQIAPCQLVSQWCHYVPIRCLPEISWTLGSFLSTCKTKGCLDDLPANCHGIAAGSETCVNDVPTKKWLFRVPC